MIPSYSKIGQGMRNHFEKLVGWYAKNELMPIYLENNVFNFYLNREIQPTETNNVNNNVTAENSSVQQSGMAQSSALVSPTKILNRDVAPIGDGIEPLGESRADVKWEMRKMKNPWKQKFPESE